MSNSPVDLNSLLDIVEMSGSLNFLNGLCKTVEELKSRMEDFKADVNKKRRDLAKKYHPDVKGGSVEKMQEINSAVDMLLKLEVQIRPVQPVMHFYYNNVYNTTSTCTGGNYYY